MGYIVNHTNFVKLGHRNWDRVKDMLIGMHMSSQVIYRVKMCSVVK